jgi:antitoxin component of RelBE/YafQ-DinJ toxin-antitoxin module
MEEVMRYDKDNKSTATIEFRLTAEEKQKIQEYCKSKHFTVSEFIRMACFKVISQTTSK